MSAPLSTDERLGEGFAYFRWHTSDWDLGEMTLSKSGCRGCWENWAEMQKAQTALKETP